MSQQDQPVETAGDKLPPPASWSAGGVPPPMTAEEMEKALENSRRIREFRIKALQVWLQSQHKAAGITSLHGSDDPYFEEWALHELWQISGGGTIECIQPPNRVQLDNGHWAYQCTWRARHRYLGQVDGHGIASSGDQFLGTNKGRTLEQVNPHNIAQAASTRAKRSAMEEILGTQGYTWAELNALSDGRLPAGFDEQGAPIFPKAGDRAPPPKAPPPPKKATQDPVQPQAPAAPATQAELTLEQLSQAMPPDSWKKEPGPNPKGAPDNPCPPLDYLVNQVIGTKLLTPEELQAHARLRRGFKGPSIREADPELHGLLASDCVRCLKWVRAALPAWNKKTAETIAF